MENQGSLFPEEKEQENLSARLLHFEDCASAIDDLFLRALHEKGEDGFHEFLDFVVRFNNLSVYNAMPVNVQRPGASAVATRAQWCSIGRRVNHDAIPIVILHPFGPVRFIYELGDTEGTPIPGERASSLFAFGVVTTKEYLATCQAAARYGVKVIETESYGTHLAGTASSAAYPEKIASKGEFTFQIKLNGKHDLPTRYATLAHELGHVYCGHLGGDPKNRWPSRSRLPHEIRELEAEAVAWLVCQRNGVKTRSKEYLQTLIANADLSQISMYVIFEAANRVESRTIRK
jgi:hypothetical protein